MSRGLVTVDIDSNGFRAAVDRCAAYSRRTFPEFINDQLRELSIECLKHTKAAQASDIRRLANFDVREHFKKDPTRKLKKPKYTYKGASKDSYKIFESIHVKKYGRGIMRGSINAYIKSQVGKRLRSVGYLKSGWIPAIRKLGGMKGTGMSYQGVRKFGPDKGTAQRAKWSGMNFSCSATAENWAAREALGRLSAAPGNPLKFAMRGVQDAIQVRIASLRKYYANKVAELVGKWAR